MRKILVTAAVLVALLAVSLLNTRSAQAQSAAEAVVARVYFTSQAELNWLAGEMDVWEVKHSRNAQPSYVVGLLPRTVLADMQSSGYRAEVDYARTALLNWHPAHAATQTSGIPSYACYRTVEETQADLINLTTHYPNLAEWKDIGDSWEKTQPGGADGYDLNTLVLTNHAISGAKPKFFLMSAIHAREYTTAETATRFAEYLVNNYGKDADATWLLDYHELHLLPYANPDGRKNAEVGSLWRKNTDYTDYKDGCSIGDVSQFSQYGVDLNRNSSFKWNGCVGSASCSASYSCNLTFRGPAAASEPETQAVQAYATSIFSDSRPITDTAPAPHDTSGLFISLHSYSQLVLFPWGWQAGASPNYTQLQTLGRKFSYFTGYTACQGGAPGCIYQTDGTTDDWVYGELGVASYTFELGTNFFQDCDTFEQTIMPEVQSALLYGLKAARLPYKTPAGPEITTLTVTPNQVVSGALITLTVTADDARYRSNFPFGDSEPTQAIQAVRYTLDAPSWITNTQIYTMTVLDGLFDSPREVVQATVVTANWLLGRHTLFVEGQDAAGNWGVPSAIFVELVGGFPLYLPIVARAE